MLQEVNANASGRRCMRGRQGARLVVGAALLADLQRRVVGRAGQAVPGVRAVDGPEHKQVVARGPEQQVAALGRLQRLQRGAQLAWEVQLALWGTLSKG